MKKYQIIIEHYRGSCHVDISLVNRTNTGNSETLEVAFGRIKLTDILDEIKILKVKYRASEIVEIIYDNEYRIESEEFIEI